MLNAETHALKSAGVTAPSPFVSGRHTGSGTSPFAMTVALPASVGFAVSLLKSTSLAAIIGISDLTKTGMLVANISFEPMAVYGMVAIIYFAMCWPLSLLSRRLERYQHASR